MKKPQSIPADVVQFHTARVFVRQRGTERKPSWAYRCPEALHRRVVNALAHRGHTLCHPDRGQLVVEHPSGVLKAPVTVEQGVSARAGGKSLAQGFMYQCSVVGVPEGKGNDSPVIKVQNGAEVELMHI